ncbi:MAG: cytochrome c peroxidase [Ekhidna sp.]
MNYQTSLSQKLMQERWQITTAMDLFKWNRSIVLLFLCSCCSYKEEHAINREYPIANEQAAIELGKKLFFDPMLSANQEVSCATCHQPSKSFTDGLKTTTLGVTGKSLGINTPTLLNLDQSQFFFFDGGSSDLASTVFNPLTHPDEMANDMSSLLEYLTSDSSYHSKFESAFNTDTLVTSMLLKSIARYIETLQSSNSRFDAYLNGDIALLQGEQMGWFYFQKRSCNRCHIPPLFFDNKFHRESSLTFSIKGEFKLGDKALGRFNISQDTMDIGKFKTPTLRNLIFTSPYMHDGRYPSLSMVLDNHPVQLNEAEKQKKMTDFEKSVIIKFLYSLTDSTVLE